MQDAQNREALFLELYQEAFPSVARYISKNGGTLEAAKDIFQDALIVYYEKLVQSNVEIHLSEKAYVLGIARHLWYKKCALEKRNAADEITLAIHTENEPVYKDLKLLHVLERAGKKCMELLNAFYYDKLPMKDIATRFGFSGERSATAQKYKCLEKIRQQVKEKSLQYEDFYE